MRFSARVEIFPQGKYYPVLDASIFLCHALDLDQACINRMIREKPAPTKGRRGATDRARRTVSARVLSGGVGTSEPGGCPERKPRHRV
jgi:hypothetical protein